MRFLIYVFFLSLGSIANAKIQYIRWEQQFGLTGQLQQVVPRLSSALSLPQVTAGDFVEVENRVLANYRYVMHRQTFQGSPIKGAMIRTWEDLKDGHLVLLEAHIDDGATVPMRLTNLRSNSLNLSRFKSRDARSLVHPDISGLRDRTVFRTHDSEQWNGGDLERVVRVRAKRGVHTFTYSQMTGRLKSHTYEEYPQTDVVALVYPIYEESEFGSKLQNRVPVILKNISGFRKSFSGDPFSGLKQRKYLDSLNDAIKASTPAGQAAGYWSLSGLRTLVNMIIGNLPSVANEYSGGGIFLQGPYADINIHPDAVKIPGVTVALTASENISYNWIPAPGDDWELTLTNSLRGQPLTDPASAVLRKAQRLADHNTATYINDGFDEIQVFYAVNQLMESLQAMGFTDPDLSTRPFHAYLYNPDIEMRDNAFYTDDTINFTTYSSKNQNYARDNTTIWHELGHGIMDRLMGDYIKLADSGGLSEGMADFVAQLIIQDVTNGAPFDGSDEMRIVNSTGFNLTNESHDDGEAYGGAMRDMLVSAWAKEGRAGLRKITDITLDAMRLARNHPALRANDWFESMLFADRLGRPGLRAAGEMKDIITGALDKRNYRFDRGTPAALVVKTASGELTSGSVGSRGKPYEHGLKVGESASHDLEISLRSSPTYQFKYPVTLKVGFNGGPLQGAAKWDGEASGPLILTLAQESDVAKVKLTALEGCDAVNTEDGACKDFAYIQVYNQGEKRSVAKKRFYIRVHSVP